MIDLVKAFACIASSIEAVIFMKAKDLRYEEVMLFLIKNREKNLPSINPTKDFVDNYWREIQNQIKLDFSSEKILLKQLKETMRHQGQPMEFI